VERSETHLFCLFGGGGLLKLEHICYNSMQTRGTAKRGFGYAVADS